MGMPATRGVAMKRDGGSGRHARHTRRQEPLAGDLLADALTVEQRRETAVPELETRAGDHGQVEVHRSLCDTFVEHPPRLVGEHAEDALADLVGREYHGVGRLLEERLDLWVHDGPALG